MKTKQLVILGAVAAGVLAAGLWSSRAGSGTAAKADTKKFCATLAEKLGLAVEVDIVAATGTVVLKKEGEAWGAAEKGGYPVDFGKVRQLVVGLSEADVLTEMTKNPAYHAKLGVQAPDAADSESKRVTIKDKSGAVLADVIIGKPCESSGPGGKPSLYARRADNDQVFEVTGAITVAGEASGWFEREVAKIESARIQRVVIAHADGERLAVSKAAPADKNFTIEDLPAGAQLMWEGVADSLASSLQYMSLEDVQKSEGFDTSGATATVFSAFDGLVVDAKTVEKDGKTWLTLRASFDEALRAAPAGPPPPVVDGAPEAPKAPELKSVDDVKKEVDELNARWSKWAYAVPGYNAVNLRKKLSDMLKKDEPAAAPEGDDLLDDPSAPDESHAGHDHGNGLVAPPTDTVAPAEVPVVPPADSKPSEAPVVPPTDTKPVGGGR